MGKFNRDNRSNSSDFKPRSFDRGGFGGRDGGRDGGRPMMHRATCSECGQSCEVPFRPTGEKPVFCSDCFRNKRGDEPRKQGGNFDRPSFGDRRPAPASSGITREQFEMLNTKLDKIMKLLNPSAEVEAPKKQALESIFKKEAPAVAKKAAAKEAKPKAKAEKKKATTPKNKTKKK